MRREYERKVKENIKCCTGNTQPAYYVHVTDNTVDYYLCVTSYLKALCSECDKLSEGSV